MSFPRYPAYKDSSVDWLGRVPEHWRVDRLKRNLSLLTEKSDSKTNPVALENIEGWSGRFIASETEFEGDGVRFDTGDILFGKLRPYLAKVLLARWPGEAVGDFHVLRAKPSVFPRFAQYLMLTRSFIDIVDGSTFGSKMPRAGWEFVGDMPLPIPSFDEQKSIVAFLDRETAKIDDLVAEQEQLITLLKEKRQAVISHAVTKGLDPSVPMKDSGVEWLGEVPAHWQVMPIKRDIEFVTSGARGWAENYTDEGDLFIRIGNLTRDSIRLDLSDTQRVTVPESAEVARTQVRAGDVLFSITAFLGSVAVVPPGLGRAFVSQHVALVRPRGRQLQPEWIAYVTASDVGKTCLESLGYGGTKVQLSLSDVSSLLVTVPPLCEQETLTRFLDRETTSFDALILEAQSAIALLQERRSALIFAAVTGQIDVRNQMA